MTKQSENLIADLQSQLAFQEVELEKMHSALYRQQLRLDTMEIQLKWALDQFRNISEQQGTSPAVIDEKPPHY